MKAIALALLLMFGASVSPLPDPWAQAEKAIKRLQPSGFPKLPRSIRSYLEQRRCIIPQSAYGEGRHNVVRGQFMVPGRSDWAALCSRGGRSTILIFSPGRSQPVAEVGSSKDRDWLQGGVGGKPDFSHSIRKATKREILSYRNAFGGWVPPRLDHDGIDDSFDGKASVVLYWHEGKWVKLSGMD